MRSVSSRRVLVLSEPRREEGELTTLGVSFVQSGESVPHAEF